jgi:hypothetical protein
MAPFDADSHRDPLADFFATKIFLDDIARKYTSPRKANSSNPLSGTRREEPLYRRAYHLFRPFQISHLSLQEIKELDEEQRRINLVCVNRSRKEKSRIWHYAYEAHLLSQACEAILSHNRLSRSPNIGPKAQFALCLNDREESLIIAGRRQENWEDQAQIPFFQKMTLVVGVVDMLAKKAWGWVTCEHSPIAGGSGEDGREDGYKLSIPF